MYKSLIIPSLQEDQLTLLLKNCNSLQKTLKAQGRLVKSTRHDLELDFAFNHM